MESKESNLEKKNKKGILKTVSNGALGVLTGALVAGGLGSSGCMTTTNQELPPHIEIVKYYSTTISGDEPRKNFSPGEAVALKLTDYPGEYAKFWIRNRSTGEVVKETSYRIPESWENGSIWAVGNLPVGSYYTRANVGGGEHIEDWKFSVR